MSFFIFFKSPGPGKYVYFLGTWARRIKNFPAFFFLQMTKFCGQPVAEYWVTKFFLSFLPLINFIKNHMAHSHDFNFWYLSTFRKQSVPHVHTALDLDMKSCKYLEVWELVICLIKSTCLQTVLQFMIFWWCNLSRIQNNFY